MQVKSKLFLSFLLKYYKEELPQNILISNFEDIIYRCDVFREFMPNSIISEHVQGGISRDRNTAILKSIMEFFERKVAIENSIFYSNGVASYPVFLSRTKALQRARENAISESLERYCLYNWYSDKEVGHQSNRINPENQKFAALIAQMIPNEGLLSISPLIHGQRALVITILLLKSGVLISSAMNFNKKEAEFSALGELFRQVLAFKKWKADKPPLSESCETHLVNLATNGQKAIERLKRVGIKKIKIPPILIEQELPHKLSEYILVYRAIVDDRIYQKSLFI